MPELLICRGSAIERRVMLLPGTAALSLGRGTHNDIDLPDPGKGVSRSHAEVRFEDGVFVVIDLGSENGLWCNGERASRAILTSDEAVTVGPYRLLLDGSDEQATVFSPLPALAQPLVPQTVAPVLSPPKPARPARPWSFPPVRRMRTAAAVAVVTCAVIVAGIALTRIRAARLNPLTDVTVTTKPKPANPPATSTEQRLREHVRRGKELMDQNQPAAAAGEFAQALRLNPSDPEAIDQKRVADERQAAGQVNATAPPQPQASPMPVPPKVPQAVGTGTATAPQPVPTRPPAPTASPQPVPGFPVARRPAESSRDYRARAQRLHAGYRNAGAQSDRGEHAAAIATLQALLAEEGGQLEAVALLARVTSAHQAALTQQAAQQAREAVDAAAKLEAAGQLAEAERRYESARRLEGAPAGIDQAIARVRARRVTLGTAALNRGKQLHPFRPADAAVEYQKAVALLPENHPDHAVAVAKLREALGGR